MSRTSRPSPRWARVSIDRVYAGILLSDRCNCGDIANDHEAKFNGRSKRFDIRCTIPGCKCTTFVVSKTRADYLAEHAQQIARMKLNAHEQLA